MLDRDGVDAVAEGPCRSCVVGSLVATDPMVDFQRVGQSVLTRVESDDLPIARRRREILGEGGDAAAPRRIGGDECDACDDGLLSSRIRLDRSSRAPRIRGKASGPATWSASEEIGRPGGVPARPFVGRVVQ